MGTSVTSGSKYKLSGSASIVSKGADTFGDVTVQTDEVTATDPPSVVIILLQTFLLGLQIL